MTHPILQAAYERRDASRRQMESLIDAAEARGGGSFTDVEARTFERHAKAVRKDDAAIVTLEADAARSEMAASASAELTRGSGVAGAFHTSGNMTYGRDGSNSFLRDLVTIATSSNSLGYTSEHDHRGALDRMATHRREIDIEARNNPRLAATLAEIRVNPNTSDGSGGEFVPPTWLVNQYIPLARASRVIANRMRREPLPTGTDSINLPKIKTGTATAIQTAQANAVQSTDATTSTVTATVNTIAGQQDISVQLIDQSPIDMTNVIFEDLSADYDQKLDVQIISGSGTGGQHLVVRR